MQRENNCPTYKFSMQATMLKKTKSKRRLTEPHISPAVLSLSATASAAAISSSGATAAVVAQQLPTPENGDRDKESGTPNT